MYRNLNALITYFWDFEAAIRGWLPKLVAIHLLVCARVFHRSPRLNSCNVRQEVGKLLLSRFVDVRALLRDVCAQKKTVESINSKLQLVMKSGKATLGYKGVLKTLRAGEGEHWACSSLGWPLASHVSHVLRSQAYPHLI